MTKKKQETMDLMAATPAGVQVYPGNEEHHSVHWRGRIRMLSALSHGAGNSGNIQKLNKEKILLPSGRTARVPFITGNALKHRVIRQPGMDFMLRSLGLDHGKLSRSCLQVLYSGGFLSAKGSTVDLACYLDLCELIPLLGLLGGSLGNVIQESRIRVGNGVLYCRENYEAGRLPTPLDEEGKPRPWREDEAPPPAAAQRDVVGYTRGDASKQRRHLQMMTPDQRALTVGEVSRQNEAKRFGEREDKGASTQMRYEVETVVAGAEFSWEVRVEDASPIELGAFYAALAEFTRAPFVGGKSAVGHGLVAVNFDEWVIDPRAPIQGGAIARPMYEAYEAHLSDRREDISKALEGL